MLRRNLHYFTRKFRNVTCKRKGRLPFVGLCLELWTQIISPQHVDRRNALSTLLDKRGRALSVINWTAVARAKLTILATVDVRPTSLVLQFITPNVHFCVEHNDVKRRAARFRLRQLILVAYGGSVTYYSFTSTLSNAMRYDTKCYLNVRSKADISELNLPHGTKN